MCPILIIHQIGRDVKEDFMKIMIHACPARMWYVDEFLVPQLREQGVREEEILVWNDEAGWGNLKAFVKACEAIAGDGGHTWHIQDDVLLAHDFAERARTLETEQDGIVCGFCCANWGPKPIKEGRVPMPFMWNGFQCVRIPDRIAGEFAVWMQSVGHTKPELRRWIQSNKGDDSCFRAFCLDRHRRDTVFNVNPNLVDHVDFLIGGTVINPQRPVQYNRAYYWEDNDAVVALREKLTERAMHKAVEDAEKAKPRAKPAAKKKKN